MIVYGAGGHGRVVLDMLTDLGISVSFVVDDSETLSTVMGHKIYSPETLQTHAEMPVLIAIGDNRTRREIAGNLLTTAACPVIHPSVSFSKWARVGVGSVLLHRTTIQNQVTIGAHVIVNTGAIIEHDCQISDFVHIAPGAVLCGQVRVGENVLIGAGATVLPHVRIGANSIIGAGSVVTTDIPSDVTVAGNPARIIKPHDL